MNPPFSLWLMRGLLVQPVTKRHIALATLPIGMAVLLLAGLASTADAQQMTVFDVPGATNTYPYVINRAGQIAGVYDDANDVVHGFVRDPDGTITVFDAPGAGADRDNSTFVTAMTPSGRIVGSQSYVSMSRLMSRGFVRKANGWITTFNATADAIYTDPEAVTPAGEIAGIYFDANYVTHGFVRDGAGTVTSFDMPPTAALLWHIDAINPSGQIAGSYLEPDGRMRGFVRDSDGAFTSFDAPGVGAGAQIGCTHCYGTLTTGTNPGGLTVGYYSDGNGVVHGFLRQHNGTITSIDVRHSTNTYALAISPAGEIAGVYQDANQVWHNFVRKRNGTTELFDVVGSISSTITGMNRSGHVAGYYQDASYVQHGFVLSFCGSHEPDDAMDGPHSASSDASSCRTQ